MKKVKRLFKVGYKFFESKAEAKIYCDKIVGFVSKGPDHKDFGIIRPSSIHPKHKGQKVTKKYKSSRIDDSQ